MEERPEKPMRPEELQDLLNLLHGGSQAKVLAQSSAGKIKKADGAPPREFDAAAALGAASSSEHRAPVRKPSTPAAGSKGPATGTNGARTVASVAPPAPAEPSTAAEWRERGNQSFKRGNYEAAIACYTASIEALPTSLGYANRAMAELKVGRCADAEQDCTQAIAMDPAYVKAHQRRGAARRELGNLAGAIEDFEAALRLEPGNKATTADRQACVGRWMRQQGFSGAEPARVPVVQASVATASAAEQSWEGELLRQVSTSPVRQAGSAEQRPAMAVVQEVAHADVDNEEALPPLPQGRPAAAPRRVPAEILPDLQPTEARAVPPPAEQGEGSAGTAAASGAPASTAQRFAQRVSPTVAMKPPRTGVEFEKAWKGFKGDGRLQSAYLQLIPPAQLPALLKQALTSALLASLLHTLLGTMPWEAPEAAVALLEALPRVPRFDVNLLSLSGRERGEAAAAWETAAERMTGGSAELAQRLAKVRERYKI